MTGVAGKSGGARQGAGRPVGVRRRVAALQAQIAEGLEPIVPQLLERARNGELEVALGLLNHLALADRASTSPMPTSRKAKK